MPDRVLINASLCIAGDIDPETTRSLIERHFEDISARNGEIFRPFVHEPAQQMQIRDYVYDAIPLPAANSSMATD